MQYHSDKTRSLLPLWQSLGQKIGQIQVSVHVGSAPFVTCRSLANEVIGYALRLLLEGLIRDCCVSKDTLIVTENKSWGSAWNAHHS